MIRSPLRLLAVPVMLAVLLIGGGFAFASNGTTPASADTSVITEAKRLEHAEAVDLRLAQEQAEADFIAWTTAAKKAEDEAKWYAAAAEAERIAHEAWHAEQDRIAAAKKAAVAKAAPAPRATAPTQTAAAAPRVGSCGGWEGTIAAYFPASQVAKACSVMMCESGGNPTAENPNSTASGLWQFLDSTWRSTTGKPGPASNYGGGEQTAAAYKLWSSSGWGPWECS